MRAFSQLFQNIDQTTSSNEKINALVTYFNTAEPEDAIWCVALLTGKRPRRTVKTSELKLWCAEESNIPAWLLEESYHIVGDLAETISLVLPTGSSENVYQLHTIIETLIKLRDRAEDERKEYILSMWQQLTREELFVFNKLITGGFRMGVSSKIVIKALAITYNTDNNIVAHKLSGNWNPETATLEGLMTAETGDDISKPYPFFLAYPLDQEPEELGDVQDWFIEHKLDGIRGQLIVRDQQLFVWSTGEELLTDKFIEFHPLVNILPNGTILDGEIIPMKDRKYLPFHVMQTRIGRKNVSKKSLSEAPLVMVCYDLLEYDHKDIRELPLVERRDLLQKVLDDATHLLPDLSLRLSALLNCNSWEETTEHRANARENMSEGLMLKRKDSIYQTGRKKGGWWKWKVDPLTIDGVLLYAQRGHGRRADLYTDFTFAVWDGEELVPFTKAYSGLTDKELVEVDRWVKRNTLDKFGPVRSVTPHHVFELAFEGIRPSTRHKSGVSLRFPRILRWRKDKSVKDANTKEDLLAILESIV